MRITLEEVIARHKKANPNTDYDYSETVLGLTIHDGVKIKCKIHGDFIQAPHEHMKGQGCPKCAILRSKQAKTTDIEEVIKRSIDLFGDKFDYTKTRETYIKVKAKCIFHCKKHNLDFEYKPFDHFRSKYGGCKLCKNETSLKNKEKEEIAKKERLRIKLEKQKLKQQEEEIKRVNKLKKLQERELRKLNREKAKAERLDKNRLKDIFIKKLQNKYGNKFDVSYIDNYVNSQTKINLYCNVKDENGKSHGLFSMRPDTILSRGVCPKCCKRHMRNSDELLEELNKKHNKRYVYFDLNNKKMMDTIKVLCSRCNNYFYPKLNDHFHGSGCPYCNRSRLEIEIEDVLKKNNIKFIPQKRFDWLGLQSLDFYLPDYNVAIECQGKQHFEVVETFGGIDEHLKVVERDKLKKQLCKENNVKLIYFLNEYFVKYLVKDDVYFIDEEKLLEYILTL